MKSLSESEKLRRAKIIDLSITKKASSVEDVIVYNFKKALKRHQSYYLRIPASRKFYDEKFNPNKLTSYRVKEVLKKWIRSGYIQKIKGYSWWGKSHYNCFKLTRSGVIFLGKIKNQEINSEFVFVKRGKEKFSAYSPTSRPNLLMSRYNRLLNSSHITIEGKPLSFNYCRIYTGTKKKGGRFYDPIQNIPKKQRRKILIGGERCVEVDINNCHLQILSFTYNRALPVPIIPKEYIDDPFFKKIPLIAINTKSRNAAIMAVSKMLDTDITRKLYQKKFIAIRDHYHAKTFLTHYKGEDKVILSYCTQWSKHLKMANEYVKKIESHFKNLSHLFYQERALELQLLESDLVYKLIKVCTKRKIPFVSVHDSFIIKKSQAIEFLQILRRTSEEKFGKELKYHFEK